VDLLGDGWRRSRRRIGRAVRAAATAEHRSHEHRAGHPDPGKSLHLARS
jgi:hypothetical protein